MTITDSMEARVSGTVGRVFARGVVVEIKHPKAQYPDRVTVWGAPSEWAVGDRVTVSGRLSWKKTERDGRTYVDVSLNQPVISAHERGTVAPEVADDPWHTPAPANSYGDETPF